MKHVLTEEESRRIGEAVRVAEARTSGEIVPVLVPRSGTYDVAVWRGAAAFAVLAIALSLLVQQVYDGWGLAWLFTGWGTGFAALLGGTVGATLVATVKPLKRWLTGDRILARRVHQRAMQAFVEEEVFDTRDRTGILLFVSLFEHRIEVLGDSGINAQVDADAWADVVLLIRDGIKRGAVADGLIEAVEQCGALLEEHGVDIRPDDTNELANRPRLHDDDL